MMRAFTGNTSISVGSPAVCLGRLLRTRLGTACAASAADSACKTVTGNCDGARASKHPCFVSCHPASLNDCMKVRERKVSLVHASDPIAICVQPACAHERRGQGEAQIFFLSNRSLSRFENPLPLRESVDILCRMPRHVSRRSMSHVEVPDPCRALGCDSACSISHTLPFSCQHDSMRMMLLDDSGVAGQML